jgi:hypothetical protein
MSIAPDPTKKRTIAILLGAPFTRQNFERTGVPYLNQYFDVVVFDLTPWVRVGYHKLQYKRHEYPHVRKIGSAVELEEAIAQFKPIYAIDFVDTKARVIQKILKSYGTKLVTQRTGSFPPPHRERRFLDYAHALFKSPNAFFRKALDKIYHTMNSRFAQAPDVALLAGKATLDDDTCRAKEVLWIASSDYYSFKRVQSKSASDSASCVRARQQFLFIDDCIAMSSDYKLLGIPLPLEAKKYFALLRDSFDRLERLTGGQVIVAAHPNGREIEGYATFFGERPVHFDLTAELCAISSVVLSHISTAIGFALLWEKPVVILTSRDIDASHHGPTCREWSRQIECPLLFMESDDNTYEKVLKKGNTIALEAYKRYIDSFIRSSDATESAPWQAFSEFVLKNLEESVNCAGGAIVDSLGKPQ